MCRKLLISDTNILIDMIVSGLLDAMFTLDYEFALPDALFEEELRENHPELPDQGLQLLVLEEVAINDTSDLLQAHRRTGVSVHDCMALALARQEECPLLTGDGALRQVSILENIEVRGTIWLVGELIEAKAISVDRAALAYESMKADGSRLPWDDVNRQIEEQRDRQA